MNKEYKLIQKYPSLPTDWEEGMIVGLGDRMNSYSPCNGKYLDLKISNSEVEQNPKFWQKVDIIGNDFYGNPIESAQLIFSVDDNFNLRYTSIATKDNIKGIRCFITKEFAQKYIEESMMFSLSDIYRAVNNWSMNPIETERILDFLKKK